MIVVDIPKPKTCVECTFSYLIQSGELAGETMCSAKEARTIYKLREGSEVIYTPFDRRDFLLDLERDGPEMESCPIRGEFVEYEKE